MTEPTKQARQRSYDLAGFKPGGVVTAQEYGEALQSAFARHVQQTSDTMREIVRLIDDDEGEDLWRAQMEARIEALARPFILPEPEDPLVEAVKTVLAGFETDIHAQQYADQIRAALAKSGKKIMIVEAE